MIIILVLLNYMFENLTYFIYYRINFIIIVASSLPDPRDPVGRRPPDHASPRQPHRPFPSNTDSLS